MNYQPHPREGYWTPLEKYWRDFLLWPITKPLGIIPYAANLITLTGFGILFWAIFDFMQTHSYERQVWFLLAAWLTDFLDGPTARNNNNITAFGTVADHVRDYLIGFWMIVLSLIIASMQGFWFMYWVFGLTIFGLFGIMIGNMLLQKEKRRERQTVPFFVFYKNFLLEDLVTTLTARIQTAILAAGATAYIAGAAWGPAYTNAGIILLLIHLFVIGFYVHEVLQARYEDRAFQVRDALQRRVKTLEAKLKARRERRRLKRIAKKSSKSFNETH